MKKLLLYAFAAIVGFASCSKDPIGGSGSREKGEEVVYELSVGSLDDSRYNMTVGGVGNVDPATILILYVMEVSTLDGHVYGRYQRYVDLSVNSGTNFRVNLMADKYKVAVWAGFTPKEDGVGVREPSPIGNGYIDANIGTTATAGNYFWEISPSLSQVTMSTFNYDIKEDWFINGGRRMMRDAYCGTKSIDLINGVVAGNMPLKRPLGRVAVYAKNMDADRLAAAGFAVPDSVSVTFPAGTVPTQYNVLTPGTVAGVVNTGDLVYGHNLDAVNHSVAESATLGTLTLPDLQLITFEYLFPTPGATKISGMTIRYFSEGNEITGLTSVVPDFPVVANKQSRYVFDPFSSTPHQYLAVVKDANGNVIVPAAGDGTFLDPATVLAEALALVPAGGTIKFYTGSFKSAGVIIDKDITIEGVEGAGKTTIYGESPLLRTTAAGFGQAPILYIKDADVNIKNVTFSIKNTLYPLVVDGLVIEGASAVSLESVVFDGINNFTGTTYRPSGSQHGRCVTVLPTSTLTADKCTFKKYNKNAVDVFGGAVANLSNCAVVGDSYNAQTVYNATAGTPTEKLTAAYAGHATQNGFVFRTGATGSVTGCSFSNITYNLDKGLRKAKYDQSRAVYLYEPGTETSVAGENDETNIYTNCELNWSAWTATPESSDATLSDIKLNGASIAGFDPQVLGYNINVSDDVATALVTAEKADFYATMTIAPATSTALTLGVMQTFTINTTSEDGSSSLEYTVNVTRVKSNVATLSALTYFNGTADVAVPGFSADVTEYSINVPYNVAATQIKATTTHAGAAKVITPNASTPLTVDQMQSFTVVVTAQDGVTVKTYTVNITRQRSADVTLSSLKIDGATVTGFVAGQTGVLTYSQSVPYATSTATITATATKAGEGATVVVSPAVATSLTVGVAKPFTITVTAPDQTTTAVYTVNVTRQAASSNSKLSALNVNGVSVPGFSATQLAYNVELPYATSTATITATAEDNLLVRSVTVSPNGSTPLTAGAATLFTVTVTAQDGSTTAYTVNVTRKAASTNSKLATLKVNGVDVTGFSATQLSYSVDLPFGTEMAAVTATAEDALVKSVVITPSGSASLTAGVAVPFTVVVTAEDNSASTYTVNVTQLEEVIPEP